MNFKALLTALLCLIITSADAQKNFLMHTGLNIRRDSVKKMALMDAFDRFLGQKEQENKDNTYILKEDLLETSAMMDELKQMEYFGLKDSNFYKCYLTGIVPLKDSQYLVQCAYIGGKDGQVILRACFNFLAKEKNSAFYFSSPMKENTKLWKTQTIGNCTFHYKSTLNTAKANTYVKYMAAYDKKLKITPAPRVYYIADHFPEALQMMGIPYKLDYNSYATNSLTAYEHGVSLLIIGSPTADEYMFDPHDLWHARLRRVVSPTVINKAVDEGCAFLYGGSWGLSWQQIYKSFMDKYSNKPETDWLALYNSNEDHGNDKSKPLLACYTINSFIIKQLEKDKGFEAVKELVSCGPYEKGNENYFKALEKLTGISKVNFNERVWALVRASEKR